MKMGEIGTLMGDNVEVKNETEEDCPWHDPSYYRRNYKKI
jgi:hypothetical protein